MRVRASTILADAWAAWRADWPVLTAIAGVFVLLPQLAFALFVPGQPVLQPGADAASDEAAMRALVAATQAWIERYGIWYLALAAVVLFAQAAMVAFYLVPRRATVGQALAAALALLPRLIGASLLWMLPVGLAALLLMQAGLTMLAIPVWALVAARTCLIAPALVAERPIGAFAAIKRSVRATRGYMPMLASIILGVVLAQFLLAMPFALADDWLKAHGPNPVVRAMVDAVAAGIAMLGGIALALIQVAAWRRLRAD